MDILLVFFQLLFVSFHTHFCLSRFDPLGQLDYTVQTPLADEHKVQLEKGQSQTKDFLKV